MTYDDHHAALIQYLKAKVETQDWHGVSDAANDLRVLEAQQSRNHDYLVADTNGNFEQAYAESLRKP